MGAIVHSDKFKVCLVADLLQSGQPDL
jgi:hypothetical protein